MGSYEIGECSCSNLESSCSNLPDLLGCICQICEQSSHLADKCPFVCPPCYVRGCNGRLKLWTSNTADNFNRKFLRCVVSTCNGFKWVDLAVLELHNGAGSRSGTTSVSISGGECFYCGLNGHFKKDCPWLDPFPCRKCRVGLMVLKCTNAAVTRVERYFRCNTCKNFTWFADELKAMGDNARVTLEANLTDLCDVFVKNASMKNAK